MKPAALAANHSDAARQDEADRPDHLDPSDLVALREQNDRELAALTGLIGDLHTAQQALAGSQRRLRAMEDEIDSKVAAEADEMESEIDRLADEAEAAGAERDRIKSLLAEAGDDGRALARELAAVGDPLAPLVDGDADAALDSARSRLRELAEGEADLGQILSASRDLVEELATRIRLQAHRVELLREHVGELESTAAAADAEQARLTSEVHRLTSDLGATKAEEDQLRTRLLTTEEERSTLSGRLSRTTTAALESEGRALRERERLDSELKIAKARAEDLDKQRRDVVGVLRKAERTGVDLARALIDLVEADLAGPAPIELPALQLARDQLAEVTGDLANVMDDEVDGLISDDVGEDLVQAAKAAGEALAARREALALAVLGERKRFQELSARLSTRDEELSVARSAQAKTAADLERARAQLNADRETLDRLTREATEHQKESVALRSEVARLGSQCAELEDRLAKASAIRNDLDRTAAELANARNELARQADRAKAVDQALAGLARQLVELAGAADDSLAVAHLKGEGYVSRFTRTVSRLGTLAGKDAGKTAEQAHGSGDPLVVMRTASEVVDKLSGRVAQLAAELDRRGEQLDAKAREGEAQEQRIEQLQRLVDEKEAALRTAADEREELLKAGKRAVLSEERLAKAAHELTATQRELKEAQNAQRILRGELEELRTTSAEEIADLNRDLNDARRRLADEQKARRSAEQDLAEQREDLAAQVSATANRTRELERIADERESRLSALQTEATAASEARRRAADLQGKLDAQHRSLVAAQDRIRTLEVELDERSSTSGDDSELAALRSELAAATAKLRTTEKRLIDEQAAAGALKSQYDGAKRKLDEVRSAHRNEVAEQQERLDTLSEENRRLKEKVAGLGAKVKTLS